MSSPTDLLINVLFPDEPIINPTARRSPSGTHPLATTAMTLSIIRPFTADDDAALTASALRFADRHHLKLDMEDRPWEELQIELWALPATWSETRQLRRLWQACLCRALRMPVSADVTVAYGYVGYHVN